MDVRTLDRQAIGAGGRSMPGGSSPREAPEALLALEDGSVWRGRSVGSPRAVTGRVSIAGDLVIVDGPEIGLLQGVDVEQLVHHLVGPTGSGVVAYGCITAAGASLPQHATVAVALARGEIGRP